VVYLKPKQLIIKDCARRFVLKLYRHEASRGLFATAELLVFFSAMLCELGRSGYAVSVCVCVCVSVTFVDCVKTNKHIFKIISPSGSHTILVFL